MGTSGSPKDLELSEEGKCSPSLTCFVPADTLSVRSAAGSLSLSGMGTHSGWQGWAPSLQAVSSQPQEVVVLGVTPILPGNPDSYGDPALLPGASATRLWNHVPFQTLVVLTPEL